MFASFAQQGSVEAIRRGGFVARLIPAMALALAVAGSTSARAGLVMSIQDVSGPSGGAGSFEVLLSNTGGTSFDVASFSLELKIEGGSFESVSTATTVASYIFDGTGGASVDPGFQFSLDNFPNTTFTASDSEWTSPSIAVGPGDIFGLGFVTYSYSAGAAPPRISFVLTGTTLSDPAGGEIPFTIGGGPPVIPEPSAWALACVGLLTVASARAMKRPRAEG